jgi:hypothetical protein
MKSRLSKQFGLFASVLLVLVAMLAIWASAAQAAVVGRGAPVFTSSRFALGSGFTVGDWIAIAGFASLALAILYGALRSQRQRSMPALAPEEGAESEQRRKAA